MCHKSMLRTKFDAADAAAIVAMQVDDGPLPVMAAHPLEVAQFALILIDEARAHGAQPDEQRVVARGLDTNAQVVTVDVRIERVTDATHQVPVRLLEPELGETMVPFLTRAVRTMLGLYQGPGVVAA